MSREGLFGRCKVFLAAVELVTETSFSVEGAEGDVDGAVCERDGKEILRDEDEDV